MPGLLLSHSSSRLTRPCIIAGVLVIDRVNGVAYVDISERADRSLAEKWASELGYKDLVTFRSTDARGKSVYHTNVMMAIGTDVAIVCAESVADAKERAHLLQSLKKTHEVRRGKACWL